jgi:hypothetical protein
MHSQKANLALVTGFCTALCTYVQTLTHTRTHTPLHFYSRDLTIPYYTNHYELTRLCYFFSLSLHNTSPSTPQYPNVVPLQAIVGQAAAHAPSQDAAAAAAAAQAPALQPPPGQAPVGLGNFNPMAWFPGGANTGAPAGGNGQTNM